MFAAARKRVSAVAGDAAEWAGRRVHRVTVLPGLAAGGCAVAGVRMMWGNGWALIAAAVFLLAIDRRMP